MQPLEHSRFLCSEPRTSVRADSPFSRRVQQAENRYTKTESALKIEKQLRQRPFVPFLLCMSDGTAYEVRHPEMVLVSGTTIDNQATIVFDTEPPIDTNTWQNTIDAETPSSQVDSVTAVVAGAAGERLVSWSGSDSDSVGQPQTGNIAPTGGV